MKSSHAYFDELCAMAAVNATSSDENDRLAEHARSCPSCRQAIEQYSKIAVQTYMEGAVDTTGAAEGTAFSEMSTDQQRVKEAVFARLGDVIQLPLRDRELGRQRRLGRGETLRIEDAGTLTWVGWAVAAILLVGLGGESVQYWLTKKHSRDVDTRTANLHKEIEGLRAELGRVRATNQTTGTKPEPVLESDNTKRLLVENESLQRSLKTSEVEREHDASELAQVQGRLRLLQSSLDVLQVSGASLEAERTAMSDKVSNLTAELRRTREELGIVNSRNEQLSHDSLTKVRFAEQQQRLLATDHDVSSILGARSLRMIDVYDVGGEGELERPFGRIFYAEGRWLVFYAFDLDQQKGLKRGAIFQAWGQKGEGIGKDTPHSLGTFYVDDPIQNRWILKVDDAKVLSRIDYVFVTDGVRKEGVRPKGRQLLSTSLNVAPNHP